MKFSHGVITGALVMLVAACGTNSPSTAANSSSSSPAPASSPATTPPPDLNAELLTTSDLPGWSTQASSDAGEPRCIHRARSAFQAASKAQATFTGGSNGLPVLEESLYYVPGHGQSDMTLVKRKLASCGPISMSSGGATFTGSIGSMSMAAVADQSSAYRMNLTTTVSGQSVTLVVDMVVFRKADTVAMILYANSGTVTRTALRGRVDAAAAKLT